MNIFRKFSLLVSMTTNQNERFGQKVCVWERTTQQTLKKIFFCKNICNEIAINANIHFSHYTCKYENLKLPWQPKNLSKGNKNNSFIERNIMNNSAKFQLYPPYSF